MAFEEARLQVAPAPAQTKEVVVDSGFEPQRPQVIPVDATAEPATPAPPTPLTGNRAVIYMNLVNTGVACLRPVQAEHLGRDFYKVAEPVPEGEQWEFQPGQVVRCRKKSLSSGKAMVAFEEAPRLV